MCMESVSVSVSVGGRGWTAGARDVSGVWVVGSISASKSSMVEVLVGWV